MSTAADILGFDPRSLWPVPLDQETAKNLAMSAATCAAYYGLGFEVRAVNDGDKFPIQLTREPTDAEDKTAELLAAGLFAMNLYSQAVRHGQPVRVDLGPRPMFRVRDEAGRVVLEPLDGEPRSPFERAKLQDNIERLYALFGYAATELRDKGRLHMPIVEQTEPENDATIISMLDRVATALESPKTTTTVVHRDSSDLIESIEQVTQ